MPSKWRQGIVAYLERLPASEWASASGITEVLLGGRPRYTAPAAEREKWDEVFGAVRDELDAMVEEELVRYRGHMGWRLVAPLAEFELSEEQHERLLRAQSGPRRAWLAAWAAVGAELGFDYLTVRMPKDQGSRRFLAEPA